VNDDDKEVWLIGWIALLTVLCWWFVIRDLPILLWFLSLADTKTFAWGISALWTLFLVAWLAARLWWGINLVALLLRWDNVEGDR
jgi:hypothetical protein